MDLRTLTVAARRVARLAPFAVGTAVMVLAMAWFAGVFQDKIGPAPVDQMRRVAGAEPTDVVHEVVKDYVEEAIGTLKAASRTVISAKVLGTIAAITVSAGDDVKQQEVLVELDSAEVEARVRQAEQTLTAAQATRTEAEQQFERNEALLRDKAVSQAAFQKSKRNLEVAQAEVGRAEQALREAKVLLSYTTIRAPRAGRIVDRMAEPGDTVSPGEPILVLYDASSLRLEAPVSAQLAVTLRIGDRLAVHIDAIDRDLEAVIDEIVPQADAPSRSLLVKVTLPNSDNLYEGMFGRLRIPAGRRRYLCLATGAIRRVGQLEFVDVVLPDETLEKRFIKTGRVGLPGRVEVLSGLKADERVVLHKES